jgi:hypothetical protein
MFKILIKLVLECHLCDYLPWKVTVYYKQKGMWLQTKNVIDGEISLKNGLNFCSVILCVMVILLTNF